MGGGGSRLPVQGTRRCYVDLDKEREASFASMPLVKDSPQVDSHTTAKFTSLVATCNHQVTPLSFEPLCPQSISITSWTTLVSFPLPLSPLLNVLPLLKFAHGSTGPSSMAAVESEAATGAPGRGVDDVEGVAEDEAELELPTEGV